MNQAGVSRGRLFRPAGFGRILALGLALLVSGCGRNPGAGRFRFVFMTDIHLEPTGAAVGGFRDAVAQVNALRPAFVVTGGDLIADALEQKKSRADSLYDLYLRESALLRMPVHDTPGNHECFGVYPKSGVSVDDPDYGKGMFRRRIGNGRSSHSFDFRNWHFVCLDGVGLTADRNYIGRVDDSELAWLADDLAGLDSTRNLAVVTHIPLVTVSTQFREGVLRPNPPWLVVSNADTVLKLLARHRLKLVLQGHLHVIEEIRWRDGLYVTGGAVSGAWWNGAFEGFEPGFGVVDVAGDAVSWRFVPLKPAAAKR